jgi:DNA-binding MarR family transcriptional regulator
MATPIAAPEALFQPETRAYLDLLQTQGSLSQRSSQIFKRYGVTEQQYHVLRILTDAGPGGLPCLEISRRLPTPAPDVTRLIDRLRRAGLVQRQRLAQDRRVVMIELSHQGTRVADRIVPALAEFYRERLAHMSADELAQLGHLLEKAREGRERQGV